MNGQFQKIGENTAAKLLDNGHVMLIQADQIDKAQQHMVFLDALQLQTLLCIASGAKFSNGEAA